MSMMRCDRCDTLIDTDFNAGGVWEEGEPFRFWCEGCLNNAINNPIANAEIMAALRAQDVDAYNEVMADRE